MSSAEGDARDAHERESLARDRLVAELAALPAWDTAAFSAWAAQTDVACALSAGALVHCLRRAVVAGDLALQELLFVALLRRIERQTTRWAHRALARTPLDRAARQNVREELKQEFTLFLWQRLTRGHESAWELYFSRALDFAQRHVAHAFLVRNGYWRSATPLVLPLSALAIVQVTEQITDGDGEHATAATASAVASVFAAPDPFAAADLADLREIALRLPYRERVTIFMRFWLAASEHEIACALGVTTRTVRNLLTRAQSRLRHEYSHEYGHEYTGGATNSSNETLVPRRSNVAGRGPSTQGT